MPKDQFSPDADTEDLFESSAPARMIFDAVALVLFAMFLIHFCQNKSAEIISLDYQPPHPTRSANSMMGAEHEIARSLFCIDPTNGEGDCGAFKSLVALHAQFRGD